MRLLAGLLLVFAFFAPPAIAEPIYDLGEKAPVPGGKTWRAYRMIQCLLAGA